MAVPMEIRQVTKLISFVDFKLAITFLDFKMAHWGAYREARITKSPEWS
jgi:hypothetical protein